MAACQASSWYLWVPVALAACYSAASQTLGFVSTRGVAGDLLGLSLVIVALAGSITVIGLVLGACIALLKGRFRRAFWLCCAIASVPLVLICSLRLVVFSPYFWYVLVNQARFTTAARAETRPGAQTFAVLETRDVSRGLVISGNVFISIVYDQTDELARDPPRPPEDWRTRSGGWIFGGRYTASRLHGHFFLIRRMVP